MYTFSRDHDHTHRISGKKRRTLHWSSNRPLFVSQVVLKQARHSSKQAILVLYGSYFAVLHGNASDATSAAAGAAASGTTEPLPVLKLVDYAEVLAVTPTTAAAVEVEHIVSEDRPKLAVGSLLEALNEQQHHGQHKHSGHSGSNDVKPGIAAASSTSDESLDGASSSSSSNSAAAPAGSVRVTYATLVLHFASPTAARAAAAALQHYCSQAAAAVHWLSLGLHARFSCQLATLEALPLMAVGGSSGCSSSSSSSTTWDAVSLACRSRSSLTGSSAGSAARAAGRLANTTAGGGRSGSWSSHDSTAAAAAAAMYAWTCQPGLQWGCSVPLPQSWDGVLAAAEAELSAAAAAGGGGGDKDVTLDELVCRVDLARGPQALVVSFTTPYGLAQATITPQIARAALVNSECRQVLAVPVLPEEGSSDRGSSSSSMTGGGDDAASRMAVAFAIGGAYSASTSSGDSSSMTGTGTAIQSTAEGSGFESVAAHDTGVYAALTVQVVKAPEAAGRPAAVLPFNPYSTNADSAHIPAAVSAGRTSAEARQEGNTGSTAAEHGTGRTSSTITVATAVHANPIPYTAMQQADIGFSGGLSAITTGGSRWVRLGVYGLLAALLCSNWALQPLQTLLQLLLLLFVAAADVLPVVGSVLELSSSNAQQRQQQQQQPPSARHRAQHVHSPHTLEATAKPSAAAHSATPLPAAAPAAASAGVPSIGVQLSSDAHPKLATGPAGMTAAAAAGHLGEHKECPLAGGWSLVLLEGGITSSPGPFLQMQIAALSCDRQTAELKTHLAGAPEHAAVAPRQAQGAPVAAEVTQQQQQSLQHQQQRRQERQGLLPVFVSDPEPVWLDVDTKQRFINAKPTLHAAVKQAQAANEWRIARHVDGVLRRPFPLFASMNHLLRFYVLGLSPERHAVVLVQPAGTKELCDAIFQSSAPQFTPDDFETHLTLLNEYLTRVAAPEPLPAGCQVLLFDMAGFKFSYLMGDSFKLFQVLMSFSTYYPERLHQVIILNAPSWFNMPYKMVSNFLDPNTRAKIMVVSSPKAALKQLAHHLHGVDNVPVAYGGNCTLPFEAYPGHKKLLEFVARLNKL